MAATWLHKASSTFHLRHHPLRRTCHFRWLSIRSLDAPSRQRLVEPQLRLNLCFFFAIVGLWPWVFSGRAPLWWALALGFLFGAAALVAPNTLARLNRVWFRFGLALHGVVNPIVMGFLYYLAVAPMGLIIRLAGSDPLRLKRETSAVSYWVRREPPGPPPDSMTKQY
jgi:hypothetical protein